MKHANLTGVRLGKVRGLDETDIELDQIDWEVNGPETGIDWRPTESMPEDYYGF